VNWTPDSAEFRKLLKEHLDVDMDKIEEGLQKKKKEKLTEAELNNFIVKIDVDPKQLNYAAFLQKSREMSVKRMKLFLIDQINYFDAEAFKNLDIFLINVLPKGAQDFMLRFSNGASLSPLKHLKYCLPKVVNSVHLDQIVLDDTTLNWVIEGSRNAKELSLYNCTLRITDKFTVDPTLEYKTELLNLSLTASELVKPRGITLSSFSRSDVNIGDEGILKLVQALGKTNLHKTLKTVYIWEEFQSKEEYSELFKTYGFCLEVKQEEF
jgi:hypothetical protein